MSVSLVFTTSNTLVSRIIRWFTNGRVSHAMILYDDPTWGGQWCAEATVGGVKMVPAEKAMKGVYAVYKCKFDALPALQAVREEIGDRYDYIGLLYFGWVILMWRLFKKKWKRPWRRAGEEYCSEFVAMMLLAAKKLGLVTDFTALLDYPEDNTPESLLEVGERNPESLEKDSSYD
jgi:hypothetical protein